MAAAEAAAKKHNNTAADDDENVMAEMIFSQSAKNIYWVEMPCQMYVQ